VVGLLCRWRIPRTWSVVIVFVVFSAIITLIGITVAPPSRHQGSIFASRIPEYSQKISALAKESAQELQKLAAMKCQHGFACFPSGELTPESIKLYGIELGKQGLRVVSGKTPCDRHVHRGSFCRKASVEFSGCLGSCLSLILVPVFLSSSCWSPLRSPKTGAVTCRSGPRPSRRNRSPSSMRSTTT